MGDTYTHRTAQNPRKTVRIGAYIASAALTVVLLLFAAGCPTSDFFAEYRRKNLVVGYDFDSGAWAVEYDITTAFTYAQFQSVTAVEAGTTAGLPDSSAPLYRIEAVNLAENGDFEAALSGNWILPGAPITVTRDPGVGDEQLDGDSLYFNSDGSDTIDYDMKAGSMGVENTGSYAVRFDFKTPGGQINMTFETNDGTDSISLWGPFTSLEGWSVRKDFPLDVPTVGSSLFVSGAGNRIFSTGTLSDAVPTSPAQEGRIDNLRIARVDSNERIEATVPLTPSGSDVDLVSGWYRFSVWVKKEDSLQVTPTVPNAFHASGLTLGVNGNREAFYPGTDYTGTEWTKVSIDTFVDASGAVDPSDTVLTLTITPSDRTTLGRNDIGRVLVSTPSVELLPDGP